MKGIDKEFDFGVLFHQHYSLRYRKELFTKYSHLYNVKLYHTVKGFYFPRLVETPEVTDDHLNSANGFVVGNRLEG